MRSSLLIQALSTLVLGALVPAQVTGTYTSFGSGCVGTGGGAACPSANSTGGTQGPKHNTNTFAIEVNIPANMVVFGFELYTAGGVVIPTQIYLADAQNKAPLNTPRVTSTMTLAGTSSWNKTTFKTPVVVTTGQRIFISYTPNPSMLLPIVLTGSNSNVWVKTPTSTTWGSPQMAPFAWKLNCTAGGVAPKLVAKSLPNINQSLTLKLSQAKINTPAVLIFGVSKTTWGGIGLPLDLGFAGAKGCLLMVSMDFLYGVTTNSTGAAQPSFPIPNDKSLINLVFHNQFYVYDTTANSFGIVVTNGGTGKIGG